MISLCWWVCFSLRSSSTQWSYSSCYQPSTTRSSTATTLPAPSWEPTSMWWMMQVSESSGFVSDWLTDTFTPVQLIKESGYLTANVCDWSRPGAHPPTQTPAASPSRFLQLHSFFAVMLLSAVTSLSRLLHSGSECACIFGAFPPQRRSSSQSPVEPRASCLRPLWLKTTALILPRIRTAILTDLPARPHARTHTHTPLGFVARVAPREENEVLWFRCWLAAV